jgi:hypothetical protein
MVRSPHSGAAILGHSAADWNPHRGQRLPLSKSPDSLSSPICEDLEKRPANRGVWIPNRAPTERISRVAAPRGESTSPPVIRHSPRPSSCLQTTTERPASQEQIHPLPQDLVAEALLKSAGTVARQTALHRKPGQLGRIASGRGGSTANQLCAPGFSSVPGHCVSEGISLYNSMPCYLDDRLCFCRRERSVPVGESHFSVLPAVESFTRNVGLPQRKTSTVTFSGGTPRARTESRRTTSYI